jgi:hypothetical protein
MPARATRGGKKRRKKIRSGKSSGRFSERFGKILGKVREDSRQGSQRISKGSGWILGKGGGDGVSGGVGVVAWESFGGPGVSEGLGKNQDSQKISERFSGESAKRLREGSRGDSGWFLEEFAKASGKTRVDSRGFSAGSREASGRFSERTMIGLGRISEKRKRHSFSEGILKNSSKSFSQRFFGMSFGKYERPFKAHAWGVGGSQGPFVGGGAGM